MPSIAQRFILALRALVGVYDDSSATAAHGLLAGILPGARGEPPPRGTAEYLQAYSTMPWLRAVTSKVSRSVATVPWQLYVVRRSGRPVRERLLQRADFGTRAKLLVTRKQAGELQQLEEHPLLDLLDSANSYLTGLAARQLTQIHLDLVGEAFWVKERNGLGAPVAVWPIPPSWVRSTPTPLRRTFEVGFRSWQGEIPDTEILWFADPDPANPYGRGSGTAQSLADELETDEYAAKHTKAWFYNRARPDLIVAADGLRREDTLRLEQEWLNRHQGFWRAFKPFFLNKEIKVHELSQSFSDMELVALRQHERDTIIQVFGLPPELLGVIENSNRATIQAAEYLFARWVLVPRLEFLRAILQERLVPEYDDRLILDYASPVAEDQEHALRVAQAAPWSLRVDEWRALGGRPPLETDEGQLFLVPINLVPTASLVDETTPSAEQQRMVGAPRRWGQRFKADDDEAWQAIVRIADRLEPRLRRRFLDAIDGLRAEIDLDALADALASGQVGAAEAHVHLEEVAERLGGIKTIILAAFEAAGEVSAAQLSATLGVAVSFSLSNPRAAAWAREHSAVLVTQVSDETRRAIRETIVRVIEQGLAPRDAARHIRDLVGLTDRHAEAVTRYRAHLAAQGVSGDDLDRRTARYATRLLRWRAETIARTETIAAANAGQQELFVQAAEAGHLDPERTRRRWIVARDERLEPRCRALDGKMVGLTEPFAPGVMMPPLHPRCLPGDARVAATGVTAASKRWYDGDLVVIHTASGKHLACTPNHPILTPGGWVAAGLLNECSHVISSRGGEWESALDQHDQDVPPRIEDVAEALGRSEQMAAMPMPVAAEDFHGDGVGSEVAVVWADRLLMDCLDTSIGQQGGQLDRGRRDVQAALLDRDGALQASFESRRQALRRTVRRLKLRGSLLGAHAAPLQTLCLTTATAGLASFAQTTRDDGTRDTEVVGEGQLGFAGPIETNQLVDVDLAAPGWHNPRSVGRSAWRDASLAQPGVDDPERDAKLARQIIAGAAGPVFADEVVFVDRVAWHGLVYNLETASGAYVAEGIVTHNCRCTVGLVLREA